MNPADLPEPARRLQRRILRNLKRARKHAEDIEQAIFLADLEARVEADTEVFWRYWLEGRIPILMIRVNRAEKHGLA
jgi:hypothetical protein